MDGGVACTYRFKGHGNRYRLCRPRRYRLAITKMLRHGYWGALVTEQVEV